LRVSYQSQELLKEKFILNYRREHPKIGKEKLKPVVDRYCKEKGIKCISVSTIGRIIKVFEGKGLLRWEERSKLSYYASNLSSGN